MDKKLLRKVMKAKRKAICFQPHEWMDETIEKEVLQAVQGYTTIACYVSFQDEVRTSSLIQSLMKHHQVVVPRVVNDTEMEFVLLDGHNLWAKSSYGIDEAMNGEVIEIDQISCFITPLLAFDRFGGRLGYGKGYYDRIFKCSSAHRIGIAYDIQEVEKVPTDPYDECLHQIITPSKNILI